MKAERNFRTLIENAQDGITICNEKGIIIYTSPNAIRHFGYTEKEVIRKKELMAMLDKHLNSRS